MYFAERPVLFVGYSLSDPDIASLIVDTAQALRRDDLPNVFMLTLGDEPAMLDEKNSKYAVVSEKREATINLIQTNSFNWVYDALKGG